MAVYFASNRLGQFGASTSAVTEALTAGRFDAAYCSSVISLPAASSVGADANAYVTAPVNIDATSVTTIYTTADLYLPSQTPSASQLLCAWVNSTGQIVARITVQSTSVTCQFSYWNGATFTLAGPTFPYPVASLFTLNTRLTCGASGSVDIWMGSWGAQVLVASVPSSAGLNAAVNSVSSFRVANPATTVGFVSLVGLTDFDLRARRLASDVATANGTFNDGTGSYTDVSSFPRDLSTARVLPASGNKFSMQKPARAIPGNQRIESVLLNAALRSTGGVVPNARNGVAIAGVWYPFAAANPAPTAGYENRGGYILVHPITGAQITSAEYNAMEFGTEARP